MTEHCTETACETGERNPAEGGAYVPPQVRLLGNLADLTHGGTGGGNDNLPGGGPLS